MKKKNDIITGSYFYNSFAGRITNIEPNWEFGSKDAINVTINLFNIIYINNEKRNSLFLQGINPKTGIPYIGSAPIKINLV